MGVDGGVGIAGIIPTLCTSRKDEAARKDAVLWTAARPLESKCTDSIVLEMVMFQRRRLNFICLQICVGLRVSAIKNKKKIKLTIDGRRHTLTAFNDIRFSMLEKIFWRATLSAKFCMPSGQK